MMTLCKEGSKVLMDNGKYVRYTPEQVEALERLYHECPKPSSLRRQQLIRECPILSHIEPTQIKVWFQNRRCREKQGKEASRLQAVNRKLIAMNKLLMEENERLQKQVYQLVYKNIFFRQHATHNAVTGGILLKLPFNTIFEYLLMLQLVVTSMRCLGTYAMFYLAAAISDFYVPWKDMVEHKIQSVSHLLEVQLV